MHSDAARCDASVVVISMNRTHRSMICVCVCVRVCVRVSEDGWSVFLKAMMMMDMAACLLLKSTVICSQASCIIRVPRKKENVEVKLKDLSLGIVPRVHVDFTSSRVKKMWRREKTHALTHTTRESEGEGEGEGGREESCGRVLLLSVW